VKGKKRNREDRHEAVYAGAWSGENIFHHRTEPYAKIMATYSGITAVNTVYKSPQLIIFLFFQ